MSNKNLIIGAVLILPFLLVCGAIVYMGENFDMNIGDHMERAANANDLTLARSEMDIVVSNMEAKGMTSGFTSVLYPTPDEDVGFWYENMKSARNELRSADTNNMSMLEESNVLMKLRESVTDDSSDGSSKLAVPDGISRFPHNRIWAFSFYSSLVLAIGGAMIVFKPDR